VSNGSRVISKDISWRLKKIAEISQRQRLYRVDSVLRYATPECGSCQRSKLSDEECLVMTRGKIVSISQEEVNLFPTFKVNTIEQFSMLKNYLLHKYLLEDRYFDEIFFQSQSDSVFDNRLSVKCSEFSKCLVKTRESLDF